MTPYRDTRDTSGPWENEAPETNVEATTIVGAENGWLLIKPNGEQWVFHGTEPHMLLTFLAETLEIEDMVKVSEAPEQPQTPDPQSSEGESTGTMVETVADDAPVIPGKSNLAADYVKHSSFDPGIAALSNGTTHPEQQEEG